MELRLDFDGITMASQMELRWHYRWSYDGASVNACAILGGTIIIVSSVGYCTLLNNSLSFHYQPE